LRQITTIKQKEKQKKHYFKGLICSKSAVSHAGGFNIAFWIVKPKNV